MDLPAFFAGVRPLFGGELSQAQVDALNAILKAWGQYGDGKPRHLAYILATSKHETLNYDHMREIWGPTDTQKRYEGRADLGNTVKGDGKRFMGRGFVQITGRRNYADWSKRLGMDLLSKPSLAEGHEVAARILVEGMLKGTFTGKKLADFPSDFVESRRIVNGTDRATLIAGYAYRFLEAIDKASEAAPERPKPAATPPSPPELQTPADEPAERNGRVTFIALVIGAVLAFAGMAWGFIVSLIDKVF
jgi:predicted chitinase